MKFTSRKDHIFYFTMGVLLAMQLIPMAMYDWSNMDSFPWPVLLVSILVGGIAWMALHIHYLLTPKTLAITCGPITTTIALDKITKVTVGTTLWAGYKPATAQNGIIVAYEKYNEVYISPESNEAFVKRLLAIKPDIPIVYDNP